MLRLAFCDDCKKDREMIRNLLYQIEEKRNIHFEFDSFETGNSLCESIKKNSYDISSFLTFHPAIGCRPS